LGEAVAAYRLALEVYTRREAPADWAATQFNLALAHLQTAEDADAAGDPAGTCAALADALGCVEAASEVYTAADFPPFHTSVERLRTVLLDAMREGGCPAPDGR
jgi:hypothetical protein